jgi:hypothetical protein
VRGIRVAQICGVLTCALAGVLALGQDAPLQPVPYSHKIHAGDLKMKCATCHVNPDPGEMMTFPQPAVCGTCHAGKYDRPIRWVRVYEVPNFVKFSHRAHVSAKNTCEECHGPVATRQQIALETDMTMGGCMECHKQKNASLECNFCHDPRN